MPEPELGPERIWTPAELKKLPTLCVGQCCSLKIERLDEGLRVWLCRVGGGVTVERYDVASGRWNVVAGGCESKGDLS